MHMRFECLRGNGGSSTRQLARQDLAGYLGEKGDELAHPVFEIVELRWIVRRQHGGFKTTFFVAQIVQQVIQDQ
jgi:hypothetical protein